MSSFHLSEDLRNLGFDTFALSAIATLSSPGLADKEARAKKKSLSPRARRQTTQKALR